jgi:hypothetical protein
MLFCLIGATIILGAILGFGEAFFWRLAGQIVHGALSIACFTLVGAAFWRFGWKICLECGSQVAQIFKEAVRFVIRSPNHRWADKIKKTLRELRAQKSV